MMYSPGDFLDKYSILIIKDSYGLSVKKEIQDIKQEFISWISNKEIENIYYELLQSNSKQYEMENKIRMEKDLSIVGAIALDIRKQNDYRVHLKNIINELLGYKHLEMKEYKQ